MTWFFIGSHLDAVRDRQKLSDFPENFLEIATTLSQRQFLSFCEDLNSVLFLIEKILEGFCENHVFVVGNPINPNEKVDGVRVRVRDVIQPRLLTCVAEKERKNSLKRQVRFRPRIIL